MREVRGEGLILGVELSIDGAPLVASALQHGLLINCTHDFTIRLLPPFIVSRTQVRDFLRIFETILAEAVKPSHLSKVAGTAPASQHAHAAAR
jgi:acetylornithine/N-succinyldiaminopimelate aminotransferase